MNCTHFLYDTSIKVTMLSTPIVSHLAVLCVRLFAQQVHALAACHLAQLDVVNYSGPAATSRGWQDVEKQDRAHSGGGWRTC